MKTAIYLFVACLFSADYYTDNTSQTAKYPCKGNKEVDFYAKYGKVEQSSSNRVVCTYANDSINVKLLLEDCEIRYRTIDNKNGNSSMAKYYNNELVFFDSLDVDNEPFVRFFAGIDGFNNIDDLPLYIRKDAKIRDKEQIPECYSTSYLDAPDTTILHTILKKISALSEVQTYSNQNNNNILYCVTETKNDNVYQANSYRIQVGLETEIRYIFRFNFYVDKKTNKIKVLDVSSDRLIPVEEW